MPSILLSTITYREEPKPSDCSAVRSVVESTGFFYPYETDVAVELVEERLQKGVASGYHFLFAEEAGMLIGYSCYGPIPCTKESYDLYWIAVENRYQGLGLGKELLTKTESLVAEQGGRRIYVETSSRPQYLPTRAFYERCGYKADAVLEDFYAPGDDKVIYVKVLKSCDRQTGQAVASSA